MNKIKKAQFEELQKMIDEKKAEVKNGELTTDMYYAYICGLLGGELFRYYEEIPNTSLD